MTYELAIHQHGGVHFVKLVGYTKKEAIAITKTYGEATLYADGGNGPVVCMKEPNDEPEHEES